MPRIVSRTLAVAALVGGLAGVATPALTSTAQARVAPSTVNFVGTYTGHVTWQGHPTTCTIVIKSNGTATCTSQIAHWTASGQNITIVYTSGKITQTLKGTKTAAGINSKAHPGSVSDNKGHHGTWYAVKQ